MSKVFGIGLSRTGTQSITSAMRILGYKTVHYPQILLYKAGKLSTDFKPLENFDAAFDTPVTRFYKELDRNFPASKFILTVRDIDSWLKSCEKIVGAKIKFKSELINRIFVKVFVLLKKGYKSYREFESMFIDQKRNTRYLESYQLVYDIYGTNTFDRKAFIDAYNGHIQDVMEYFADRESDLLIMDIIGGDGWDKLCPFLNKQIPHKPFPHRDDVKRTSGRPKAKR